MDNDWKSSGHGTLSEQESRARQLFFAHDFLDALFNFLSFICVIEFSYHFHVQKSLIRYFGVQHHQQGRD